MKKTLLTILITSFLFTFNSFRQPYVYAEDEKLVTIPVSFSYSSVYWWRGVELYGNNIGVMWPGIAVEIAGFSVSYAAGISEEWIRSEDTASEDSSKAFTEMDYGISYSMDISAVSIGIGVMYVQYPYYDETDPDATDPSFWEGSVSLGINTILSPTVEFYYDYYVEEYEGSDGEDVPVDEDYYAKLSVSQDIISTKDGFTLSIAAWLGYYNNAYLEADGWSDAGASLGISKEHNNLSFSSSLNYGRTISKDFRDLSPNGIKNHFWCDFGITYSLL